MSRSAMRAGRIAHVRLRLGLVGQRRQPIEIAKQLLGAPEDPGRLDGRGGPGKAQAVGTGPGRPEAARGEAAG